MLLIPAGSGPVPELDSVGPGNTAAAAGPLTCTSTHPASPTGSTRTILAFMSVERTNDINNDYTMTCGGTAMTQLATLSMGADSFGLFNFMVLYGLLARTSTSKAVVGGVTGADAQIFPVVNSVAYLNVSAFGTAVTNSGTSVSPSLNVASVIGQMVMAAFYSTSSPPVDPPNGVAMNKRTLWNTPPGFYSSAIVDAPGADTVAFTGKINPSEVWGAVGVPLIA